MTPASAKAKGRRLQQWVRDRMLALVPALGPTDVMSRGTGAGGTDLILSPAALAHFPVAVECKNTERVNLWAAWDQAMQNSTDTAVPMLVIARNRQAPLAVVDADWLLTLLAERP